MIIKYCIFILVYILFVVISKFLLKINFIKSFTIITLVFSLIAVVKIYTRNYIDDNDISANIKNLKQELSIIDINIKEYSCNRENLENYLRDFDLNELNGKEAELANKRDELLETIKKDEELEKEKNNKYKTLTSEYEDLKKKKYLIENFPTYKQSPNYPNGCEPVALYLILKYYNVNVTMEDIVNRLDKGKAPYFSNGSFYGGDPEKEFVGDPRLINGGGYGVYQKPIIKVANTFKSGMKDISGSSLTTVLKIVGKGHPVQVWATVNMNKPKACITWKTDTGKKVTWQCGFHSLVIIGFTYNTVITSDPSNGKIVSYNRNTFEQRYNFIGKRAIYYEK